MRRTVHLQPIIVTKYCDKACHTSNRHQTKEQKIRSSYIHCLSDRTKQAGIPNFHFSCSKAGDTCFTVSGLTTQPALFIPLHPPPSSICVLFYPTQRPPFPSTTIPSYWCYSPDIRPLDNSCCKFSPSVSTQDVFMHSNECRLSVPSQQSEPNTRSL